MEVLGNRIDVRRDENAARRNQHHHQVQQPEHRRAQHLPRGIVRAALDDALAHGCHEPGRRFAQEQGKNQDHEALADFEGEERRLVARLIDHVDDRQRGECGSRTETGRRDASGETPSIGKPLQSIADAGAVHRTRADATDDCGRIEHGEAIRIGVHHPGNRHHDAAEEHHDSGAVTVDEPGFDGHEPRLGEDEDGEGDLNGRTPPVVLFVDRVDEQRPAVLEVGDHHHADDAEQQLQPPIPALDRWRRRLASG